MQPLSQRTPRPLTHDSGTARWTSFSSAGVELKGPFPKIVAPFIALSLVWVVVGQEFHYDLSINKSIWVSLVGRER